MKTSTERLLKNYLGARIIKEHIKYDEAAKYASNVTTL
jgi:hypothetical protein